MGVGSSLIASQGLAYFLVVTQSHVDQISLCLTLPMFAAFVLAGTACSGSFAISDDLFFPTRQRRMPYRLASAGLDVVS